MKKYVLFSFLVALILVVTMLPAGFLSANPGNLVVNGDFSDGLDDWTKEPLSGIGIDNPGGTVHVNVSEGEFTGVWQMIDTSNKKLTFSFDLYTISFGEGGEWNTGFWLVKNGVFIDIAGVSGQSILDEWLNFSYKISDIWGGSHGGASLPDFDEIGIFVGAYAPAEAYFDNVKLTSEDEEEVWVRTQEMTCKQVWINEDNKFQFSFIYPYADNNWVRIYDMAGNMVYEIDMPLDNPNIIVDLPDGMYTVKTFHDQLAPIQEFVIGKP